MYILVNKSHNILNKKNQHGPIGTSGLFMTRSTGGHVQKLILPQHLNLNNFEPNYDTASYSLPLNQTLPL